MPVLALARGITGNMPASIVGLCLLLRAGRVSRRPLPEVAGVLMDLQTGAAVHFDKFSDCFPNRDGPLDVRVGDRYLEQS